MCIILDKSLWRLPSFLDDSSNDQTQQPIHLLSPNWLCCTSAQILKNSVVVWTKDFVAQLMKATFRLCDQRYTWTHGAHCCAVIAQIPLQWSCLLIDLICTVRSYHKVQYDVWQIWASESETNISLYFWLNKVPPKENCIPPMCTEAKKKKIWLALLQFFWIMWWS